MFILPNKPQSMSQLLGKILALSQLTFSRALPFVLVVVVLFDTPTLSHVLWGNNILNTHTRVILFELIESLVTTLLMAIMLHQTWGLMHNRERDINVSTTYVYARFFRVLLLPIVMYFVTAFLGLIAIYVGHTYLDTGHLSFIVFVGFSFVCIFYHFMRVAFALPFMIIKDENFVDALKKSWLLTGENMWKVLLTALIIFIIFVPCHMLLDYLDGHSEVATLFFDSLLTTVALVVIHAAFILLFHDFRLTQEERR